MSEQGFVDPVIVTTPGVLAFQLNEDTIPVWHISLVANEGRVTDVFQS